jgi:hypothetical protein
MSKIGAAQRRGTLDTPHQASPHRADQAVIGSTHTSVSVSGRQLAVTTWL